MSLQDLLAGYSQDINARIQHEQDHDQEVADRKATTVEEHFQHFKDAMESAGQEAGVAGMAIHMGRKVWKKYQEKYRNKPGQSGDAEEQQSSATENPEQNADPDQRPVGDEEPPAEGETGGGEAPAGAESGEPGTGSGVEAEAKEPLFPEAAEAAGREEAAEQASAREGATFSEAGEKQLTEPDAKPSSVSADAPGDEHAASIAEADPIDEPTSAIQAADGVTGEGASLTDMAGNVAETAAKTAAQTASSGLDTALGVAGDALDFLGPLGEVAGLGLGIYSLIKGLEHKHPKEVVEQNQQQQQEGAGIDAEALKQSAPVVGTLV